MTAEGRARLKARAKSYAYMYGGGAVLAACVTIYQFAVGHISGGVICFIGMLAFAAISATAWRFREKPGDTVGIFDKPE